MSNRRTVQTYANRSAPGALAVAVALVTIAASPSPGHADDAASTAGASTSGESAPPPGAYAPCTAAPKDMVCIPGGAAIIGTDGGRAMESPQHTVDVSTFYLDKYEVSNGDYKKCERVKACAKRKSPSYYKPFQQKDRPVVPTTWQMAQQYCVWAGKRLPTEAEWEKAARGGDQGTTYPWGNDAPTCDKAHYKTCPDRITKKKGAFAPGHYGVHDLAGNGYEWVKDWASPCFSGCKRECGIACVGRDPKGPCDGAAKCPGYKKRVLKGGSWYWPADQMRGAWRRAEKPSSGLHRLSFRCASSRADLYGPKPLFMTDPLDAPAKLQPPSDKLRKMFADVVEDTDIFKIPECGRTGKARVDCRDPMSYIQSNEAYQYLFKGPIRNLGGGYVGVASDQNYSFIAAAKSEWVWLFDYDPAVVRNHAIMRAVILNAETPSAFVGAFMKKNAKETAQWITTSMAGQPEEEIAATLKAYRYTRKKMWPYYARQFKKGKYAARAKKTGRVGFGWLRYAENYNHIRTLWQQGRIQALKGNMLTDKVMPSIAASAKSMGVVVRIYYPSNAEEQWKYLPQQYRDNVMALPFDERSVILRTLFAKRYHDGNSRWHYVVQGGQHAQEHIGRDGYRNVWRFMEDRQRVGYYADPPTLPDGSPDTEAIAAKRDFLSLIGLPARTVHEEGAGARSP